MKRNNELLTDKIRQNKYLYAMQHQASLKSGAKEMLSSIKKVIEGTDQETVLDWDEFIEVMDTLYPMFNSQVFDRLGKLKPLQIRTCYLLKAGYAGSQIQHILSSNVSRATAWRWIKVYGETLADVING